MFRFEPLEIPAVVLVTPEAHGDRRGFFMEHYRRSSFVAGGILDTFVQDNHSFSGRGVLRGLHYQSPPKAHSKLVSVVQGEVLDVALDLRRGSPTYGRHVAARLSAENRRQLYVPVGFAHGFAVLSETAYLVYKLSSEYAPEHDRGLRWNDPALGIDWGVADPVLSDRDQAQPTLEETDSPFRYEG